MNHRFLQIMVISLCGMGLGLSAIAGDADSWQKVNSTHFLVMHTGDETLARSVSERAESYYSTIATDLGYTRYKNFWLWDNRVKILIYPNAQAFATACHAPAWAAGAASYRRHEISSYRQSGEGFLSSLLPHELSHLILSDFIGENKVPLWLSEGFAQWEQSDHQSIPPLPPRLKHFPLKDLMTMDIRRNNDRDQVALFYAQSASLVGYLIKTFGGDSFGSLCRALRDGKPVEAALATTYPSDASSLETLEQRWIKAITR